MGRVGCLVGIPRSSPGRLCAGLKPHCHSESVHSYGCADQNGWNGMPSVKMGYCVYNGHCVMRSLCGCWGALATLNTMFHAGLYVLTFSMHMDVWFCRRGTGVFGRQARQAVSPICGGVGLGWQEVTPSFVGMGKVRSPWCVRGGSL
jgi:hypothetical protein